MSKIFSNFVAHFVRIALTRIYDEISDQKIIMAIKENPKITRAELQNITGLSESGVKKILRQLQQKGLLSRIGPDKGGHWEIIDK